MNSSCSRSHFVSRGHRPRRPTRRLPHLVAVVAFLLVATTACGSDPSPASLAAGAKENTTGGSCADWVSGAPTTCALNTRGPGGGRVFYDAGSVQPWGRFLEVAPQKWISQDPVVCPGTVLGASTCPNSGEVPQRTVDVMKNTRTGYHMCAYENSQYAAKVPISGPANTTRTELGTGRSNTAALLAAGDCTVAGWDTAVTLAAGYRGGGLDDWFLGSKDEMYQLCRYEGRNDIGGFFNATEESRYGYNTSSAYVATAYNESYQAFHIQTMNIERNCASKQWISKSDAADSFRHGVRPIRAF